MTHLLARLCLAALACTATIACEDEGPDSTTDANTETSGEDESGESGDTGDGGDGGTTTGPGTASAASTLAPPPESESDTTSDTTGEEPDPTTIGTPKDAPIGDAV